MFQSVGERLNAFIIFIFGNLKRKFKFKNQQVSLVELIAAEIILAITITIFAAYVFMEHEGWSYFDAIYYCFITLTTIGILSCC